jgi:hypothetical protein
MVSEFTEVTLADGKDRKKVWRKQILPNGTREYHGKNLDFSRINPACVDAFNGGAFDAVPFVLPLTDNRHPDTGEEATQLEGDTVKLELGEDGGLYGYFDFSNSPGVVSTISKSNGKFGVSGRIEVDYVAGDTGKKFPYALSHVCGTTRPHIKGLAHWQPVDLSEEEKDKEVIDFSTEVVDDTVDTPTDKKETGDDLVAVEIPKSQLDRLLALAASLDEADEDEDEIEETADEIAAKQTDETNKRIAAAERSAKEALELAETMQIGAAQTRWGAEKATLLSAGVPPAILDLAEKVMSRHRPVTLTFSEGDTVDATEVIRNILEEAKGVVPLMDERGHSFSDNKTKGADKEYDELAEAFNEMWERDLRSS